MQVSLVLRTVCDLQLSVAIFQRRKKWDDAQVTLLRLEGKNGNGGNGELDGKSMQNCVSVTSRTMALFSSLKLAISVVEKSQ